MQGILDPYAPRPDQYADDTSEDKPSEEEEQLAKQIDKLFDKLAKARKQYDKNWVDYYKMYRGDQWSQRRPVGRSREVINLIYQTIQSQTAVMLDTRPTVGFLPQDPADLELSEILNQVFESDWQKNNWSDEIAAILYDGNIYGTSFSSTEYVDDYTSGQKPGIVFKSRDPFDIYPDCNAVDFNKECFAMIDAKPTDIDLVKKMYAGHKYVACIKPDLQDMNYDKRKTETLHRQRNNSNLKEPTGPQYGSNLEDYDKDQVLVMTAYLYPSDIEEVEKEDEDGSTLYIKRLKYPNGRKVVKINKYIFCDEELPYEDKEFPFERYVNTVMPREFFGMSEIEQLKGPQLVFNRLVNYALDVLMLMGNPIWLVPTNSGVNTRKLINEPGLVVEHDPEGIPQRLEGVQLQPYVLQLIDRMEKWFNDEAGTQDVTRGVNPTGVTANAAIENLLEAAQKRIKQKMRNLDSYMKQFARHWLSRCFQFYTVPQIYRLTNNEGASKYFKFHVEHRDKVDEYGKPEVGPDGKPKKTKVAVVRDYMRNDQGQMVAGDVASEYEVRAEFDVRSNTISGLPFTKAQNETTAFNLFDRGIIDAQEVLTRLEYPNKEQILLRMKDQAAQAAAQQPQAKGA